MQPRLVISKKSEQQRIMRTIHEQGHQQLIMDNLYIYFDPKFNASKTITTLAPNSISFSMICPQIQSCDVCQCVECKFDKPALSLHPVPVKLGAWQQIGADLVGPLPETPLGNKYIMTVTDYFSKWPEAKAIWHVM